jgi:hypothetical protein
VLYTCLKSRSWWAHAAIMMAAIVTMAGCSWQYLDNPMSAYHYWRRGNGMSAIFGMNGSKFIDKGECVYYNIQNTAGDGLLGAQSELCLLDHGFHPGEGRPARSPDKAHFEGCVNRNSWAEYYYDSPVCYWVRNGYKWPLRTVPPIRWSKPGMTATSLLKDLQGCYVGESYKLFSGNAAPDPRDRVSEAQRAYVRTYGQGDYLYLYNDLCMRRRGYAIDENVPRTLWPIQMKERFGVECPFKGACYTVTSIVTRK